MPITLSRLQNLANAAQVALATSENLVKAIMHIGGTVEDPQAARLAMMQAARHYQPSPRVIVVIEEEIRYARKNAAKAQANTTRKRISRHKQALRLESYGTTPQEPDADHALRQLTQQLELEQEAAAAGPGPGESIHDTVPDLGFGPRRPTPTTQEEPALAPAPVGLRPAL